VPLQRGDVIRRTFDAFTRGRLGGARNLASMDDADASDPAGLYNLGLSLPNKA
jgi:hypothetical protein